eukprot:gene24565-29791_t
MEVTAAANAYCRIQGPNKQPPKSALYSLATTCMARRVDTFDEVVEGAEGQPIEYTATATDDLYLQARCITNGDCVGRGTCVLRGGCIAVAEKFFGR